MTDETRARFLTAIAAQLPVERIVEIHLFAAIRQGGMESGVAVVAVEPPLAGAATPNADDAVDLEPIADDVVDVEPAAEMPWMSNRPSPRARAGTPCTARATATRSRGPIAASGRRA